MDSRPRYLGQVRALLVDLDDTLLDYSGGVEACWTEACKTCCAPTALDADALIRAIADARVWFWSDPERHRRERVQMQRAWQRIVERALGQLEIAADGLSAAIAADFAARRREMMRLFPDALRCLTTLRQRGVALALVTNGDASQQRDKIERHGLAPYFDTIVIEGEFGTGKPEPAVYRHALAALGAQPHDAWMVGDHLEWDVAAPMRLGLSAIWIDRAGEGLPAGSAVVPHRVIRSLDELTGPTQR
jgi:putative hydrolase of the HAD superfamily